MDENNQPTNPQGGEQTTNNDQTKDTTQPTDQPADKPTEQPKETPEEDTNDPVDVEVTARNYEDNVDNSGEGDDLDDELENRFNKRVEPVYKRLDQQELNGFLQNNPDFKKYETSIKKHMDHPAYRNVPIDRIAYAVAGEELMRIGARRAKQADDKANRTRSSGGGSPSIEEQNKATQPKGDFPTTEEIMEMKPEEFQKFKQNQLMRR